MDETRYNTKQLTVLLRQISRTRKVYVNQYNQRVGAALQAQIKPVIESLETRSPDEVKGQLQTLIKPDSINAVFRNLFVTVGATFARNVEERITKSDEDPMIGIWEGALIAYVTHELGPIISSISINSRDKAGRLIDRIMREYTFPEGAGIFDTAKLFQKEFNRLYGEMSIGRAKVISQTEVLRASNKGSHMGAQSAGATRKVWLTSGIILPDSEPRHVGYPGLHMQERALDEAYDVRGYQAMYPCDPGLPAGESINCHCAEVYRRI